MNCPYCGSESQVVDSRATSDGVRRRRSCNGCKRRFTTYERVGAPLLKVIKRSAKAELFDSDKLQRALKRVCRSRPGIDDETIRRIARAIEAELVDSGARTVPSGEIAALALERLGEIDTIAHDRLAANYIDEDGRLRTDSRRPSDSDVEQLGLFDTEAE